MRRTTFVVWITLVLAVFVGSSNAMENEEAEFSVQAPCQIEKNRDEPGRAGSNSAYWIRNCESGEIRLEEALVFTKESIHRFDEECKQVTGYIDGDGCWESVWRPHLSDLDSEQQALNGNSPAEGYQRVTLNSVDFLVHEITISSSGLALREYVTYRAGSRYTIWVYIQPDTSTDIRQISAAQRDAADRLASEVRILEETPR